MGKSSRLAILSKNAPGCLLAGEDVVRGDEVVVLAVRQRAHDGELVGARRQLREVLAREQAGRLRLDRLVLAANLGGASGLGSHVSRWLAAPVRKTMMSDFGFLRSASDA